MKRGGEEIKKTITFLTLHMLRMISVITSDSRYNIIINN